MGFTIKEDLMPEQMTEQVTAHMEISDGHSSVTDHVNFMDMATQYWWVGVIFIIGAAFTAKALYRVGTKIPIVNEIFKMWKKS